MCLYGCLWLQKKLSFAWYNIDYFQLMSWFEFYQLQLVYLTWEHCLARNFQRKSSKATFDTLISHSSFSMHKTFFFFLHFSLTFIFLEIIKHNMPKCYFILPSSMLKWLHKNSPVLISTFKMHTDMTAVTIQSNRIVSNEVILWSHLMEKLNEPFGQLNI